MFNRQIDTLLKLDVNHINWNNTFFEKCNESLDCNISIEMHEHPVQRPKKWKPSLLCFKEV